MIDRKKHDKDQRTAQLNSMEARHYTSVTKGDSQASTEPIRMSDGSGQTSAREIFYFGPVSCCIFRNNGDIVDLNARAAAMLGWQRSQLVGQPFSRWVLQEDIALFSSHLHNASTTCAVDTQELQIKSRYGWPMHVQLATMACDTGDSVELHTVILDVSARKQAEQKVRQLEDDLAHLSRIVTMNEIACSLAHELNQPLGAISLYCSNALRMLHEDRKDTHTLINAMEQTFQATRRAREIIAHIKGFLRKDSTQRTDVSLNQLIRDVKKFINADIEEHGGDLRLELATGLPIINIDRVQIEQVLINLVCNAIEAMCEAGCTPRDITIRTAKIDMNTVQVCVLDTGPKIELHELHHVFDSFYTCKTQGLGMGLSISRSIIEAHGGRIWATVNKPQGAAFYFQLPVSSG